MSILLKNYYSILNVNRNSSQNEIQQAYRILAKKYHPDINNNIYSEKKFQSITEAYRILRDPSSRSKYDKLKNSYKYINKTKVILESDELDSKIKINNNYEYDFFHCFYKSYDKSLFQDTLDKNNNVYQKHNISYDGNKLQSDINITLEDALFGATKKIILYTKIGERKIFRFKIPSGVSNGSIIRLLLSKKLKHYNSSDLLLKVCIKPHYKFRLEGNNLHMLLLVSPWEAALGAKINIKTLHGIIKIKLPAGFDFNKKLRIKGKGLVKANDINGDLIIKVKIVIPKKLTYIEEELFRKLKNISKFNARSLL